LAVGSGAVNEVAAYLDMVAAFLRGDVPAETFAREFEAKYLADATVHPQEVFDVLEALFGAADSFVSDEELRAQLKLDHPAMYVDEEELRRAAAVALAALPRQ
jgi:hypothetical protein